MEIEKITANKIIDSLLGRGGFDDIFGNLDEDIYEEIVTEIAGLIKVRIEKILAIKETDNHAEAVLEMLISTIERGANRNEAKISNVKLWANSWREELKLLKEK